MSGKVKVSFVCPVAIPPVHSTRPSCRCHTAPPRSYLKQRSRWSLKRARDLRIHRNARFSPNLSSSYVFCVAGNPSQEKTVAVVGDVHDAWTKADHELLHSINPDLVLFVGDFGNENLDLIRLVASLDLPKAVVLGNHDGWFTATDWGRRMASQYGHDTNSFAETLKILGDCHVGFDCLDIPELGVSVVGGRPVTWGGPRWSNPDFYWQYFQVRDFEESADRMVEAMRRAAFDTMFVLSHTGPSGLGDQPQDICGRDWYSSTIHGGEVIGGDFGDPDLEMAIQKSRDLGKHIPLVCFGHMHRALRNDLGQRNMLARDESGTIYVNAADVPRIRPIVDIRSPPGATNGHGTLNGSRQSSEASGELSAAGEASCDGSTEQAHGFSVVRLSNDCRSVLEVKATWLSERSRDVVMEELLYISDAKAVPVT